VWQVGLCGSRDSNPAEPNGGETRCHCRADKNRRLAARKIVQLAQQAMQIIGPQGGR
jgi:hypothetical protein